MEKTRDEEIREMYEKGLSQSEISRKYNLSRERIGQILGKRPGYAPKPLLEKVCGIEWCTKKFVGRANNRYCIPHSERLARGTGGRDHTRELVRIRDKDVCMSCSKVWGEGERKFDVHHLGNMCGKNSRGYDSSGDLDGMTTLCHKCHIKNHAVEKISKAVGRTTDMKKSAIFILRGNGWSYQQIADVLNMKYPTIARQLGGIGEMKIENIKPKI